MSETSPGQADSGALVPSAKTDQIASDEQPGAPEHPEAGAATTTGGSLEVPTSASLPGAAGDESLAQVPAPSALAPTAVGDPRVDDAVSRLAEVDSLPLIEQVEVYADIHRRLAGVLSDPDSQA